MMGIRCHITHKYRVPFKDALEISPSVALCTIIQSIRICCLIKKSLHNVPSEKACVTHLVQKLASPTLWYWELYSSGHMFPFFISQHCCNNFTCKKNPNFGHTQMPLLLVFFCFMCTHMHATTFIILLRTQSPNFKSRENHHFKKKLKKMRIKELPILTISKPSQNQWLWGKHS